MASTFLPTSTCFLSPPPPLTNNSNHHKKFTTMPIAFWLRRRQHTRGFGRTSSSRRTMALRSNDAQCAPSCCIEGSTQIRGVNEAAFPRRLLLLVLSAAAQAPAMAAVSRKVRLKDVEDPKLQDALRAAVAGDLENAERLFTELIQEAPESASTWSNRGSVRISMKQYENAANDLTKAIELAPEASVPFLNRAIVYEALGRYQEAVDDCKAAIQNDPEEFAAWYNLGNVDVRVNDYDSALTAYKKASELAPGIAGYRLKQALVLFQLKRLEEARKLMQGLVRKYPNYAEAHAALAAVLWSEGEWSRAEEQFSDATSLEPLYHDIMWVNEELQWPPSMVQAIGNFLSIS